MIDRQRLLDWPFEDVIQAYSERDTMLYALGLGLGADPTDPHQLQFVYERGLKAFPTLPVVLCHPGPWIAHPDTGINRTLVVHGEQRIVLHQPLKTAATVRGRTRVTGVVDKGPGKGALVYSERSIVDEAGQRLATLGSTSFCRGDGGFSGRSEETPPSHTLPHRDPDRVLEFATVPQLALLYRLNADYNPLHADPEVATTAGYARPILHGLCTFGIAARAIVAAFCDHAPARLRSVQARFSAPVFPGETIAVDLWDEGSPGISFRARVPARGVKVLDNGFAEIA